MPCFLVVTISSRPDELLRERQNPKYDKNMVVIFDIYTIPDII